MKKSFAMQLAAFIIFSVAATTNALADYVLTVTIGDTTLPSATNGPVTIPAGNYYHAATGGTVTIADSGGPAQVEFTSSKNDSAEDAMRLKNVRITAVNGVNNFPIVFQGQMQSAPNTPPTIYYKMKAVGYFLQPAGSSILVGMYLKNPTSEGFTFMNQLQHTPGALAFTINPPGTAWPPAGHANLSGTRVLRVDTAIKLANTKYLDFNTANNNRFIEMYSSANPDKGNYCDADDKGCEEQDVPGLYLPSLLNWNDGHGRQNWVCRVFGIFCSDWP